MKKFKKKSKTKVAAIFISVLLLAGCAGQVTNQDVGMVSGGVLGGLAGSAIGHSTGATIAGAVGGALVGSAVGRSYDRSPYYGGPYYDDGY